MAVPVLPHALDAQISVCFLRPLFLYLAPQPGGETLEFKGRVSALNRAPR